MSGHTPGPWQLTRGKGLEYDCLLHAPGKIPVAYWSDFTVRTKKESLANARLIAAAPDLLEALKAMLGDTEDSDYMTAAELRNKARAAIAKAGGLK